MIRQLRNFNGTTSIAIACFHTQGKAYCYNMNLDTIILEDPLSSALYLSAEHVKYSSKHLLAQNTYELSSFYFYKAL